MKGHIPLAVLLAGLSALAGVGAEEKALPGWSLLWTGSAELSGKSSARGGTLENRGDLRLWFPWQGLGLRAQVTDRRPLPPWYGDASAWETFRNGLFAPGGGLYHGNTGSRLLYGPLDEYGLAARIRNVWAKSVPFVEYHRSSVRDLKTEASSTAQDMSYLYLASPVLDLSALGASLPGLGAFAYGELDEGLNPAFGGGLLARWGKKASLSAEGFYTGRELAPRKVQSWFSAPPPLPQREFRVAALGLVFLSPHFALASDLAWSETFAYGRGLYGNAGLRVTFNPWIFSLAADGAGDRFTGRDGAAAGPGFRTAARVERKGKKSSLLRLSGTFRSPGWGEDIDRFTLSAYYRFPAPRTGAFPLGISRLSFALDRDMRESGPPMGYEALLGLRLWFVGAAFSGALGGGTGKASGELSWYPGRFQLRTKLGWTLEGDGEKVWDASIYGALRWKWGRISVKIAATELPRPAPENFTYTLSCRLEKPRRSPARGR